MNRKILVLGTRGIPGKHGGFETFAERLALYLVKRGWEVTVYCQEDRGKYRFKQKWQGINLVHIPVCKRGALWSIIFDLKSTLHALHQEGIVMVFGYNTAVFSLLYYLKKRVVFTNMDGMEWWREKWNGMQKAWLYINERCGIWFSNYLIADHPRIREHFLDLGVSSTKIKVIPYGTEPIEQTDLNVLKKYNLTAQGYALVVARPEPENSLLEIVSAFSHQPRGYKLVVLGRYLPEKIVYHRRILAAASQEVEFIGAVYTKEIVNSLRVHARLYIHGHTVGGTNPSLVEALAAGTPILAQNNYFNYWVAGDGAHYFEDEKHCQQKLTELLDNISELIKMRQASLKCYQEKFTGDRDLKAYENLFLSQIPTVTPGQHSIQSLLRKRIGINPKSN